MVIRSYLLSDDIVKEGTTPNYPTEKKAQLARISVKGGTRFPVWVLCLGFISYIFSTHDLIIYREFELIWPFICDTQALWQQTRMSLCRMLWKSSKRQQIWHGAKRNVNQCIYYWGHQQLICMMSWWSKSNKKRKWKVGICTCSNFSWPN